MEVAIVGGGAAGLFAAWQAARSGCRVRLLERGNRVGRKLLLTGSGRCNLSNERAGDARYYHGSVAVAPALRALPPAELERQLGQLGLALRRDHAGRIYPWSGQAASVLDALRFGAAAAGAELLTGAGVVAVTPAHRRFILTLEDGRRMTADRVIFCPGGRAAPDTGSDGSALALLAPLGHAPTALRPGLVPLRTDPALLRGMEGQRLQGRAAFFRAGREIAARTGEIQLTRSGAVSGICVLDLAREALGQEQEELRLDLLPECSRDQVLQLLDRAPGPTLADRLGGLINKRVAAMLAKNISSSEALAGRIKDWRLPVRGSEAWSQAQVTVGGIPGDQVDPETMASRQTPGLSFCGEVLDVDGDCGGFNLHWAFASAFLAVREGIR